MTWNIAIMYAVATLFGTVGVGFLLRLRTPRSDATRYVLRMTGVMALAAAIMLGASATALWRWTVAS